ncbi:hypothetical protein [Paenibacillus thiaminolyticus]
MAGVGKAVTSGIVQGMTSSTFDLRERRPGRKRLRC